MKNTLFLFFIGLLLSSGVFAQNMVTVTKTWTPVTITVDENGNTYAVTGTVPATSTEYYYTYPGYRCVTKEYTDWGNGVVYHSSATGGSDIWCYAEEAPAP